MSNQMARSSLDPGLFDRADRAHQSASAFLERGILPVSQSAAIPSDSELQEAARSEAKRAVDAGLGLINLTADDLTPGMDLIANRITAQNNDWNTDLERNISSLDSAINDIENETDELRRSEIPNLTAALNSALKDADRDFETSQAYVQNREQHRAEKGRFEYLRGYNRGNFPKTVSNVLYWALLGIIGFGDMAVNYSVFLSKFEVIIALCFTIIIGGIVAVTSHIHGKYFKQRKLLFSEDFDDADRKGFVREVLAVTIAFVVCLGVIFWARYSYFAAGAGLDFTSDGLLSAQFVFSKVGPTLFFNLGVWFIGAVISFIFHERVPGLREAHVAFTRLDSDLARLREGLDVRKAALRRTYENDMRARASRLAECQARAKGLAGIREQLDDMNKNRKVQMTAQIAPLLHRYAEFLCSHIVTLEGDASAIAFASSHRGKLSMLEFAAGAFSSANT
jgi:hypothetical protein